MIFYGTLAAELNKRTFKVYVPESYEPNLTAEDMERGYSPSKVSILAQNAPSIKKQKEGVVYNPLPFLPAEYYQEEEYAVAMYPATYIVDMCFTEVSFRFANMDDVITVYELIKQYIDQANILINETENKVAPEIKVFLDKCRNALSKLRDKYEVVNTVRNRQRQKQGDYDMGDVFNIFKF